MLRLRPIKYTEIANWREKIKSIKGFEFTLHLIDWLLWCHINTVLVYSFLLMGLTWVKLNLKNLRKTRSFFDGYCKVLNSPFLSGFLHQWLCGFDSMTLGRNLRRNSANCHFFFIRANLYKTDGNIICLETMVRLKWISFIPECLTQLLWYS